MAQNDEFIREVDEEYRRDQMAEIWKRYNGVIVGVAILVVAAVGGWRYWQHMQAPGPRPRPCATRRPCSSRREGKSEEAEKALEDLAKDAPAGYGLLARFRLAAEMGARTGGRRLGLRRARRRRAVEPLWQDLARLRAACCASTRPIRRQLRQALEPLGDADQRLAPFRPGAARPRRP